MDKKKAWIQVHHGLTTMLRIEGKTRRREPLTELESDYIANAFQDIREGRAADNALGLTGKQGRNIKDLLGRNFDIVWLVDTLMEDQDRYTTAPDPQNGKTNVFEAVENQEWVRISAISIKRIYYDTRKEVHRRIALDKKLRSIFG